MSEGVVSSVVLMVKRPDGLLDFAQLLPTPQALPPLNGVVQGAAVDYADSPLIDYDSSATTAEGEVMWIKVSAGQMLQAIADGTHDPANMPLFDPGTARLGAAQVGRDARDVRL